MLRERSRSGFAQPMRRTMLEPSIVAPLTESVAEAGDAERPAVLRHKKGEVARLASINHALESGQHGEFENNRAPVTVLVLGKPDATIANVLAPKMHDVSSPLAGVAQESQGERS